MKMMMTIILRLYYLTDACLIDVSKICLGHNQVDSDVGVAEVAVAAVVVVHMGLECILLVEGCSLHIVVVA